MKWQSWAEDKGDTPSPRDQRPEAARGRGISRPTPRDTPVQGWGGGERLVAKP